jgi:hypothetical protein
MPKTGPDGKPLAYDPQLAVDATQALPSLVGLTNLQLTSMKLPKIPIFPGPILDSVAGIHLALSTERGSPAFFGNWFSALSSASSLASTTLSHEKVARFLVYESIKHSYNTGMCQALANSQHLKHGPALFSFYNALKPSSPNFYRFLTDQVLSSYASPHVIRTALHKEYSPILKQLKSVNIYMGSNEYRRVTDTSLLKAYQRGACLSDSMKTLAKRLGYTSLLMDAGVFTVNAYQLMHSLQDDKASREARASHFVNANAAFLVLAGGFITTTPLQLISRLRLPPQFPLGLGLSMIVCGKTMMSLESQTQAPSTKALKGYDFALKSYDSTMKRLETMGQQSVEIYAGLKGFAAKRIEAIKQGDYDFSHEPSFLD